MQTIEQLTEKFTTDLTLILENNARERAKAFILRGIQGLPEAKAANGHAKHARKKAPRQLCPVPGCKNPAAPVFGMVCAKHKNVSKKTIAKYRAARRAKKEAARN
jgi:hypothetical protein